MYYQVFVDEAYVRGAQVVLEREVENFDCLLGTTVEDGWTDFNGRMLLAEGVFLNVSELKGFVKKYYPEVDLDVLFVLAFPEEPVLIDWGRWTL